MRFASARAQLHELGIDARVERRLVISRDAQIFGERAAIAAALLPVLACAKQSTTTR